MEKFQLTIRLAAPMITGGGYMTLDALLAAVLFDEHGDVNRALKCVVLRMRTARKIALVLKASKSGSCYEPHL